MASSMAVPRSFRSAGAGRGKKIPLISHPMEKLGNQADLTIRGTSSLRRPTTDMTDDRMRNDTIFQTRRPNTEINNHKETDYIPTGRKSCPERILQWPPVCDYVPPYSYRKSPAMHASFLPIIEEGDEQRKTQRRRTEIDITVVEQTVKGKKKERLKLPSIEKIVEIVEEQREHLLGPYASPGKVEELQFSPTRDKVMELTDIVREKMTTGYFGLRHLFRANDPTGQGNVSREALLRILYSLCGFITRDQYSSFLKSLCLDGRDTIDFDSFVSCFKDNETVQKQWVSPVQRSALEEALKRRHPEEHLKLDLKKHDPYTSAPFSDTIFKSKLKTINDARKVFPVICFETDGMIVPPQLREAYAQVGIYMRDSDFQVLWERYDTEGTGGIRTMPFLRKLGVDLHPRPRTFHRSHTQIPTQQPPRPKSDNFMFKSQDIIEKVQHDVETNNTVVQEEKKREQIENGNMKITQKEETKVTESESTAKSMKMKQKKTQPKLDNIIDCLHYRFEETYNAMLTAFELFDYLSDGYISRVDFRKVLQEFGFNISITDLDHFLSRASIRSIRGQLNYKEFLNKYQSKSENSMTNRIITNQSHIFQHDSQPLPNSNLSVDQMESKLVDYFHGDFLKLISFLKSCDKYGLGVITPHEFRSALEKRLGYPMSEKQWEQLKTDVGQDKDGLIPYNKFLQLFDVIENIDENNGPGSWNTKPDGGIDVVKVRRTEMPTHPVVDLLKEKAKTTVTPREEISKLDGSGNRTIAEIHHLLEELFRNKFHTFDKHFKQMDRKMMGRMSKWQFGALIKLCGLTLNQQELDKTWVTLNVANDSMYSYRALISHFIQMKPKNNVETAVMEDTTEAIERARKVQRERREKKAKEIQSVQEKVASQRPSSPPVSATSIKSVRTKDLLIKVKQDVISNWEGLKSVFRYIDKNGCTTVNYSEMTEVMNSMKFSLTADEQAELLQRFDLQKNGRFHYLEFMKCFSHRPPAPQRYKTLVYSKHAHKLEQKLMNEHKNLKRAFKRLDRQNRGHLSIMDFKKALVSCKVSFSNEDFYHLLSEFDHDMTGKISYQNFLTTCLNANL